MAHLAPIHRPSSVRHALKLNLLDRDQECLVLAKANRLEIWALATEGLVMVHSKAIYGKVSMLARIRPHGSQTDHLFVGTQRFHYFTICWNAETQNLDTIHKFVDASEKQMRDSQSRDRCLIDPTGRHLVMELFEGVLNLVKIGKSRKGSDDYLGKPEQVRIAELRVRATCFLHTETNRPKIAFLYENGQDGDVRMATYRIVDEKAQYSTFDHTKDRENEIGDLDIGASHLIPVPKGEVENKRYIVRNATGAKAQIGGVIVVGETKMTYLDDESKVIVEYALDEASIFVAWERYDDLRYFLGDDYGNIHLLTIIVDGVVVTGMDMRKLGTSTKATVMVNMGEGLLYIGSHEGDCEVVRVDVESEEGGVELLQSMDNNAPILDFAVMDMGGREGETQSNEYSSGQARLVTGSGAYERGSLRSVRSGVGLEDIGVIGEIEDIRGVFALRSSELAETSDTLLVSLPTESRVFTFDAQAEVEEVESFRGLVFNEYTLLAMNLPKGLLLQVTTSSVSLLGHGPTCSVAQWKPPAGQLLTAASANEGHVLLSANGVTLVSLDIQNQLQEVAVQDLGDEDQVACIHVPAQFPNIGVVGFWKSGSISILNLSNLQLLHSEELRRTNNASIPRDVALAQVLSASLAGPTLFVAMEDGIVLSFSVDKTTFSLSGRKSIVLGTQQARFQILPRNDGLFNIFATCEHPSLIYGSEGRIVYSAVTAENAICVCPFDSEAFPNSIILATPQQIKISQIDTERRTHVTSLPMGKTIRRIAYSAKERAFGIGSIKRTLSNGQELIESSFELVEDILFGQIGKPFILGSSAAPELVECLTRAELPVSHGAGWPAERFIVGTSYLNDDPAEQNARGRLLVFGIDGERTPYLVCSHVIKGGCRQVAILDGKIVASLIKTVVMYSYIETSETTASLTKLATYRTSTCPIDLSITGNIIAVADLMKSVSLVEYVKGVEGMEDKLVEVARHQQACWSTGVISLGDEQWLESDQEGNLLVLKRNLEGLTEVDQKRLEVTAEFNLGEQVNRIRKIEVDASASALVIPKAFLATTEGSIYLLSQIPPQHLTLLTSLQTRLASHPGLQTLGELDFNSYRAFKNPERETGEPYRFVDGELIERFLDVGEGVQREVVKGLGPSVEDVRGVVEELKRLH